MLFIVISRRMFTEIKIIYVCMDCDEEDSDCGAVVVVDCISSRLMFNVTEFVRKLIIDCKNCIHVYLLIFIILQG